MEGFIAWCGFLGAWLLVAGPLYQAAVELVEDSEQSADIKQSIQSAPVVEGVSLWWWLFPPAYLLKHRAASKKQHDAEFRTLTADQRRRTVIFVNKAAGWMTVAGGAFLIALKETWELTEEYHWSAWLYVVLIIVPFVGSIWNASSRISRSQKILKRYEGQDGSAGSGEAA